MSTGAEHNIDQRRDDSQLWRECAAGSEEAREELINRVTEGIQQTAASGTKFSHMLTPEEDHIMREVIREYLT